MRGLLRGLLGGLGLAVFAHCAHAQPAYPARTVQAIIGFTAGGSVDIKARNLLMAISIQLGQQFVPVNREGASGAIAFAALAGAKPDGYTLGAGPTTPIAIAIAPHLQKDVKYGVEPFEYICQSFENVFTVAVPAESPFRSMNDVLAEARARWRCPWDATRACSRCSPTSAIPLSPTRRRLPNWACRRCLPG